MSSASNHLKLPSVPTAALPGSAEKVRVLAERASQGVSLWHPPDAHQALSPAAAAAFQAAIDGDVGAAPVEAGDSAAVPCVALDSE